MFTYQIRRRVFRLPAGTESPSFPSHCVIRFHLKPPQPFGTSSTGGVTANRDASNSMLFDANTGRHIITSTQPLGPVDVRLEYDNSSLHLVGSVLTYEITANSIEELNHIVMGYYFVAPMILNVELGDPPTVARVDGTINDVPFRWELMDWKTLSYVTTLDEQERKIGRCLELIQVVGRPGNRRLLAALNYFHLAVRLERVSETPGEFLAEVILNLCKVLEVLFPPNKNEGSRDAARRQLLALGFTVDEINRDFIPVMALRNEVDVGHVELGLMTHSQLATINNYVERAERTFRDLLRRVVEAVDTGSWQPRQSTGDRLSQNTRRVIERLAERQ